MWTGTMSIVRGVIFRARSWGSMQKLPSTSQSTGMALAWTTAPAVATQKNAGTMTSQPGPIPSAVMAVARAPVPLLTARACLTP